MSASGEGYTVASLAELGDGPGFRKVRAPLGVTAFGVNAIILPPGTAGNPHRHDEQQELYFVHRGYLTIRFGDGSRHLLAAGGLARVDPATVRMVSNDTDEDVIYLCVGGKDGYVGRDAHLAEL